MNVGDFSTVFAAQTAAVRTRHSEFGRSEAEAAARRGEKRERDVAELRSLAPVAESRKIADGEKLRRTANEKTRFEAARRGNGVELGDERRSERFRFAELGARIDVFC